MNKFWLIIFISSLLFSFDLPKNTIKKIDKVLAELWPEREITQTIIELPEEYNKNVNAKGKTIYYKLTEDTKPVAFLLLASARSKISEFDYMVVFDTKLAILKVKVLVYREEYGGEIGSNRWLKQFIGKSDPEKMEFGHDIQNISGATISARSISEDIKRVTKQIIELKTKGVIQ
jgi:Na+-translocating ferredoxin:NAD+ oxidoreductase RnfG subunit